MMWFFTKPKYNILYYEINVDVLEKERHKMWISQEAMAEYLDVSISTYEEILRTHKCWKVVRNRILKNGMISNIFID